LDFYLAWGHKGHTEWCATYYGQNFAYRYLLSCRKRLAKLGGIPDASMPLHGLYCCCNGEDEYSRTVKRPRCHQRCGEPHYFMMSYRHEPPAKALSFTHIFGKTLDKRIYKAEVLLISAIQVALPSSFTKSIC